MRDRDPRGARRAQPRADARAASSSFHEATFGGTITLERGWPRDRVAAPAAERYAFVWNRGGSAMRFEVDGSPRLLPADGILCLPPGRSVAGLDTSDRLIAIGFDRSFYCAEPHDRDVSCDGPLLNGMLGAAVVTLDRQESATFGRLLDVIDEEFRIADTAQAGMLRLLLKRFIIKCTRVARRQLLDSRVSETDADLVRRYAALVETNFRKHHRVRDYADMLYRSPKTLANAFRGVGSRPPQDILLDRIALEARRLLHFTDRPVKRIASELGFDDAGHFSRFFKTRSGVSPLRFRRSRAGLGESRAKREIPTTRREPPPFKPTPSRPIVRVPAMDRQPQRTEADHATLHGSHA